MRKDGFSIAEFLISITIMFVIAAAALPTLLIKKSKELPEYGKKAGEFVCSCSNKKTIDDEYTCRITLSKDMGEFYSIQIVGGGAGGDKKGGGAGESKVIHYPGMDGEYIIKLGLGGIKGKNGGHTAIYKINDRNQDNVQSTTYTLVEFARGGITTNEKIPEELNPANPQDAEEIKKLQTGEAPGYSEYSEEDIKEKKELKDKKVCGRGGDACAAGNAGEVIIRW